MSSSVLFYNACLADCCQNGPGALLVDDGKIQNVFSGDFSDREKAAELCSRSADKTVTAEKPALYDCCGLVLMPAFIDMHVHFRYPGLTQKEDLNTGLRAAVAGGFCTVVAMPNTKPVVSSEHMAAEIECEGSTYGLARLYQTVSLTRDFGGTDTSHLDNLDRMKVPVVSEDGHDVADAAVMLDAMRKAAAENIIVSCHSEDTALAAAAKPYREKALSIMRTYSIPAWGECSGRTDIPLSAEKEIDDSLAEANRLLALAEDTATERNLEIARLAGCRIHIAHVSTKRSMEAVERAKRERPSFVTCEVTPHHLALCGTEAPFIRALVNPPLRSEEDRRTLIEALRNGTADVISTDHAPHTMADKAAGSPGFTGLETAFAVCCSVLVHQERFSLESLSACMSAHPACILDLKKGRLLTGYDADLVLVDPEEEWTVDAAAFASKGKASPFNGTMLRGRVHATFIGGRAVFTAA